MDERLAFAGRVLDIVKARQLTETDEQAATDRVQRRLSKLPGYLASKMKLSSGPTGCFLELALTESTLRQVV